MILVLVTLNLIIVVGNPKSFGLNEICSCSVDNIISDYSGASMYNFNDEEEEDDSPSKEKMEENEQLKEKMKQVRLKMDKLNISKKVRMNIILVQIS